MLEVYYKKDDVLGFIENEIDRFLELGELKDHAALILNGLRLNIEHGDIIKEHVIEVINE